jgi:hypothetical protein
LLWLLSGTYVGARPDDKIKKGEYNEM